MSAPDEFPDNAPPGEDADALDAEALDPDGPDDADLSDPAGEAPPLVAPAGPRDARLVRLLGVARALPREPGVYLMKDAAGTVVYVGKALVLAERVSSYFVPSADLGYQKNRLLDVVEAVDVIPCESEWEALLTENRLIKDLKPRFNVRLTDDKTFPYLAITMREDFPRVFVTRAPSSPDLKGARIFGPFTNAGALREAISILQKVFKFRTCHLDIDAGDPKNARFRPCLLYAINQCTAPCADKVTRDLYRADIDRFLRFLAGKRSVMLRELRAEMEQAAAVLRFEQAAAIRDQIRAIEKLDERATRGDQWQPEAEALVLEPGKALKSLQKTLELDEPIRCIEGIDIAHLKGGETVASKVSFIDGRPFKSEYRRYKIRTVEGGNDDYASIREAVSRRYRDAGEGQELFPDVIVIDGGLGQLHAALEVFDLLRAKPPMVISLAKKEELIFVQRRAAPIRLPRTNPGLRLVQAVRDEAHRFAQHYHHVLRRKKTLEED
ncbi:MAG: excinuclease ABC subunit UvrC [Planctomycetota bacterium]|nr:excinuclease ABC subunit UvrC [Planctomycetota bacterium]